MLFHKLSKRCSCTGALCYHLSLSLCRFRNTYSCIVYSHFIPVKCHSGSLSVQSIVSHHAPLFVVSPVSFLQSSCMWQWTVTRLLLHSIQWPTAFTSYPQDGKYVWFHRKMLELGWFGMQPWQQERENCCFLFGSLYFTLWFLHVALLLCIQKVKGGTKAY